MKKTKLSTSVMAAAVLGSAALGSVAYQTAQCDMTDPAQVTRVAAKPIKGTAMTVGDLAYLLEINGWHDDQDLFPLCRKYQVNYRELRAVLDKLHAEREAEERSINAAKAYAEKYAAEHDGQTVESALFKD